MRAATRVEYCFIVFIDDSPQWGQRMSVETSMTDSQAPRLYRVHCWRYWQLL